MSSSPSAFLPHHIIFMVIIVLFLGIVFSLHPPPPPILLRLIFVLILSSNHMFILILIYFLVVIHVVILINCPHLIFIRIIILALMHNLFSYSLPCIRFYNPETTSMLKQLYCIWIYHLIELTCYATQIVL